MTTYTSHIDSDTQSRQPSGWPILVAFTLSLVCVMIGLPQGASPPVIPVNTCPAVIMSAGSYRLEVDCLVTSGNAIEIGANNVDLNLNDHTLSGPIATADACPTSNNIGIYVSGSNVHVHNGIVIRFRVGIQSVGPAGHDDQMSNLSVTGNCEGVVAHFSDNNVISGSNLSGNWEMGLRFQSSNGNRASNNVVNNNGPIAGGAGIFLENASGNVINGNDVHVNQNEPGMRLINAHNNAIRNNRLNGNSSHAIRIDGDWSHGNLVQANTAVLNGADFADFNSYSPTPPQPPCINTWRNNIFYTDTDPGSGAGPSGGCIQ